MDVRIVDTSSWEKTIEVKIPREELELDIEKAYQDQRKKIQLEGFRKGKAPLNLIKKIFGKEIEAIVAENKVSDVLVEIGKQNKFKPISPAKIEDYFYDGKEGLKFKVFLQVAPKIELQNYKGLALEKNVYQVGELDITEALENLRDRYSTMVTTSKPAELNQYMIADFQKLDNSGFTIVGEKYEDRYFRLTDDSSNFGTELTDQVLGMKAGESRHVKLMDSNKQERDQQSNFLITVKEIKEKKMPELDDEFAKDIGDFQNLDELKSKMKVNLEQSYRKEYEEKFFESIIDELIKSNLFEIPEPMIVNYLNLLIERLKKNSKEKIDDAEIREKFRGEAIRRLKWSLIKEALCEKESITITNAEVDDYIENLATHSENNGAKIRNYYRNKENREQLEDDLLERKVFNFLTAHAQVTETPVDWESIKKESKLIV